MGSQRIGNEQEKDKKKIEKGLGKNLDFKRKGNGQQTGRKEIEKGYEKDGYPFYTLFLIAKLVSIRSLLSGK